MVESSASQGLVSALSRQTPAAVSPHRRSFLTFLSSLPPATNGIALGLCGYMSLWRIFGEAGFSDLFAPDSALTIAVMGTVDALNCSLFGQAWQCLGVCGIGVVVVGISAQDAACAKSKCACTGWLASYETVMVQWACAELLGGRS